MLGQAEPTTRACAPVLTGPPLLELRNLQRALCELPRAQIVAALRGGPLAAGDLAHLIGRPGPATSQHLRVLRELGVVRGRRRRSNVFYELRPGPTTERVLRVLADVEQTPTG